MLLMCLRELLLLLVLLVLLLLGIPLNLVVNWGLLLLLLLLLNWRSLRWKGLLLGPYWRSWLSN